MDLNMARDDDDDDDDDNDDDSNKSFVHYKLKF